MKRGFTLLEILVVLAIIGIVAAAGVAPALAHRERDARSTAADVSNLLHRGRTTALSSGRHVTLWFDLRTGRYWAQVDSSGATARIHSGVLLYPPGVRLDAPMPRPTFRFDPRGGAFGDSIVVRSAAGRRVVGVDGWTGTPYVRP